MGKVSYRIFKRIQGNGQMLAWEDLGNLVAHSAESAESAACKARNEDGEYVAIADSTWSPDEYEVVTTRTVKKKSSS